MEVLLKVFDNEALAKLWAGVIENEGIRSMVKPAAPGWTPMYLGAFVPHGLYVLPDDEARARALLEEGGESTE